MRLKRSQLSDTNLSARTGKEAYARDAGMQPRAPIRHINAILIHGIGNPKPGSVKRQAEELLARAGVPHDHVHEFNWNQYVAHPVTLGFLSPRSLSELSEALLNAAWFGFESENRIVKIGMLLFELDLGLFPLLLRHFYLNDSQKPLGGSSATDVANHYVRFSTSLSDYATSMQRIFGNMWLNY
jgi:hypothetical protein